MNTVKFIEGGVTAPEGFKASGIHAGIRKNTSKKDLACIFSSERCAAAAVYTQNLVKGAPILVTKQNLKDGYARAIICNSGNANTCNPDGEENAKIMCSILANELNISVSDVIVASTGVIGMTFPIEPIANGIIELVEKLNVNGSGDAADAILTTDTCKKEYAVTCQIGGKVCTIGGISKGSGMINPNMATMLCFLTTDLKINPFMLQKALSEVVEDTFNMISVDGDTSTNDMVSILANGLCGNELIEAESEEYIIFKGALHALCTALCRDLAKDGEGATKLIECIVKNAGGKNTARKVAKTVIASPLVKTAVFGADANWGRVLCAVGYAGEMLDVDKIDIRFQSRGGEILLCENGKGVNFSEQKAKEILLEAEIKIIIDLKSGEYSATARGCDLTYDYVKINGDYRT